MKRGKTARGTLNWGIAKKNNKISSRMIDQTFLPLIGEA